MLRRELFKKLKMIARCLKDNSQPFGGIQLIFSGDFYQLRPVTQSYATNESLYCFASPMWASCVDVCVFFYENYRQCDTDLIDMLDDFRTSGCFLSRPLNCDPLDIVRLHSHRESVTQANDECLALIPGNIYQLILACMI